MTAAERIEAKQQELWEKIAEVESRGESYIGELEDLLERADRLDFALDQK